MSLSRAIGLLITAYLGLIVATALAALSWRPLPDVPFLVATEDALRPQVHPVGATDLMRG